jgi:phosphoglycerol transferase
LSRRWLLLRRGDVLGGVLAASGALLVAGLALHIWHASPHVPFQIGGDATSTLNLVKNQLRGNWYYTTNLLGAPFGQKVFDYPAAGDALNLLGVKALGLFSSDPALVTNAFFVLTFPLVALGAFVAMRVLRVQVAVACSLAVVYSILPYHFQRGEPHLFLTAYFAVPLACVVLIRQMDSRTIVRVPWRDTPFRDAFLSRGTVCALLVCLLIAATGLYYAFFFVLLAAIVGVFGGIRDRSIRPLLSAALLITVVFGVLFITNVPSLLYRIDHGANSEVANRPVTDADNYGLKIANLVLPVTGHRVGPLATLKAKTLGGAVPSEGTEALGIIGAAGFVGLLAVAFARLSTRRRRDADPDRAGEIVGQLSALTITCLVFAVIGGGATLVGALGFSNIRAWNRISVYIAFFSLTAVGIWLTTSLRQQSLRKRWTGRRFQFGSVAVAALLVLVAAYDQTTPAFTPAYAATAGQYGSDRAFVSQTERVLGRSASIFQLPYVPFPENPPVVGMTDYDHLRGYIHSDSLRWSYGGVKGRESGWQPKLLAKPIGVATIGLATVGFDGLYIDRAGYADRAARLESQLRPLLGPPLFESGDKRLVMYDLRPLQRRIATERGPAQLRRARDAILHPPGA